MPDPCSNCGHGRERHLNKRPIRGKALPDFGCLDCPCLQYEPREEEYEAMMEVKTAPLILNEEEAKAFDELCEKRVPPVAEPLPLQPPAEGEDKREWELLPSQACKDAIHGPDFDKPTRVVPKSALSTVERERDGARDCYETAKKGERHLLDAVAHHEARVRELEKECDHWRKNHREQVKRKRTKERRALRKIAAWARKELETAGPHAGQGPDGHGEAEWRQENLETVLSMAESVLSSHPKATEG